MVSLNFSRFLCNILSVEYMNIDRNIGYKTYWHQENNIILSSFQTWYYRWCKNTLANSRTSCPLVSMLNLAKVWGVMG